MKDTRPDDILAKAAKEGDVQAFEKLFGRYKMSILNYVYRMVGNREIAEDVTQDAFIRAYKGLHMFNPKMKFTSWLYTIARNLAKNALRDKKYFRDVSLDTTLDRSEG